MREERRGGLKCEECTMKWEKPQRKVEEGFRRWQTHRGFKGESESKRKK